MYKLAISGVHKFSRDFPIGSGRICVSYKFYFSSCLDLLYCPKLLKLLAVVGQFDYTIIFFSLL